MDEAGPRPLEWVGSSKDDLRRFPGVVQDRVGYALYLAQLGRKHGDAKPMTGLGPGVMEVVAQFRANTYRLVYAVEFREAVYVLHAFQKKSKRGIATPKQELDLIKRRQATARRHHQATYGEGSKT